jgi:hypothetical protein
MKVEVWPPGVTRLTVPAPSLATYRFPDASNAKPCGLRNPATKRALQRIVIRSLIWAGSALWKSASDPKNRNALQNRYGG